MLRLTNRLFNTSPLAAHCPGPPHESWRRFCDAVLAQRTQSSQCEELTIITWNSGPRPAKPCGLLEQSLTRLGVSPIVLGQNTPNWRNIMKFRLTAEALRHVATPYVLGADSSDVVMLANPALLLEQYRRHYTCDLVFNATGSRCWPEFPEFVQFESSLPMAAVAQGRHWLNSGLWIGSTEFCREFFANLAGQPPVPSYEYSEQAVVKRVWPQWYPRVQLDYLCLLFQWFNEDKSLLLIQRDMAARQQQLLKLLKPLGPDLRGAEVGVYDGLTSDALLRELPGLQLWMVDPWTPYADGSRVSGQDRTAFQRARERALWWTQHAFDRRFVLQEASPRAAERFSDGSLDFIFIDGNHLYEHVRADLHAWWPKVRPGGLLTGHDYGVYRDAEQVWGVRRAVDEFAGALRRSVGQGLDGVWWLQK